MSNSITSITTSLPRIDDARLARIAARLADAELPAVAEGASVAPGIGGDRIRELVATWRDDFDWRALEQRVEALGHVVAETADGRDLAAIVATAEHASGVPILLVHGWPDSPLRFLDLIPLLTAAGHDVVAPAIPGFWHSTQPEGTMSRELVADDFAALMSALGYDRFAVHGGDWGSVIAQSIASRHPEAVAALHLTDVPFDLAFTIDRESASPAEVAYLDAIGSMGDGALYLTANTAQANATATLLQDSPAGLVAWLGMLYDAWSNGLSSSHVVANAATLALTGTVRSSIRLYTEPQQDWGAESEWDAAGAEWDASDAEWGGDAAASDDATASADEAAWGAGGQWGAEGQWDAASWAPARVEAPTAFAMFPQDIGMAPRELADRHFAVERFTVMPRGGHFAALEEPSLLATDLIELLADRR